MVTTPVFLSLQSHGQRSMVVYSPWGHKELDTTEQLSIPASVVLIVSSWRPDISTFS